MNLHSDSLWIGALIKERIDAIAPVYPCIASESAPAEFCVYRRAGYSGHDTKDRFNYSETVNIVISIVAPTYIRSIELAQKVKDRLDGKCGVWNGKRIDYLAMTNAVEEYAENNYMQHLYFSIDIDTSYGK